MCVNTNNYVKTTLTGDIYGYIFSIVIEICQTNINGQTNEFVCCNIKGISNSIIKIKKIVFVLFLFCSVCKFII